MIVKTLSRLRGTTLAIALAIAGAAPVAANGLAGDYLAARHAGALGDYRAAAEYYGRAILFDPTNSQLLERAVLANISLGDIERAAALADKLVSEGYASQLAQMALLARDAGEDRYGEILARFSDDRGVGPLADNLLRAWALLGQGDMTAALVQFDDVGDMPGIGPFANYHKAIALASVGDFESAEMLFGEKRTGGMGDTRRGVLARVEILSQLDRNGQAADLIRDAFGATLDPRLAALVARLENGDALPFTHVRSARDGMAEVFYTLAGALSSESSEDFTLLYSRIAEHLRPSHADAMLMSAELLETLGQYDLAVATYNRVPRDDPSYHAAELGRADALRAQGRTDAALEVLEQLSETHGDLPVVQSTLGDLNRHLERFEAAIEAYSRALDATGETSESDWFLFYARGICRERLGQWDSAEADFRKALDLNPEQPQVLNYLGYSLVEKKTNLDEALEMIERAVAAEPESGYIVDSLGWALYRLGRYEDAVEHMERAAELMPIDPVVNDHLGDVYWAVGRNIEARFQWKRALSFVDWEGASEDVDPDRIRRKLEIGLDRVLAEEGSPALRVADGTN